MLQPVIPTWRKSMPLILTKDIVYPIIFPKATNMQCGDVKRDMNGKPESITVLMGKAVPIVKEKR